MHRPSRARAVFAVALVSITTLATGCRRKDSASCSVTIAAAISLKEAISDVAAAFEREHAECKVELDLGASGELARQIEAGAPVDLFVSADERTLDRLVEAGRLEKGSRRVVATNRLALVARKDAMADLRLGTLASDPRVKRLAIGSPATVPAGAYAERWLTARGLLPSLKSRLVQAGNVRQVLDYVARGEADAGLVYATDVATVKDVEVLELAPADELSIKYPAAVVVGSAHAAEARSLLDLLAGAVGRSALSSRGFLLP